MKIADEAKLVHDPGGDRWLLDGRAFTGVSRRYHPTGPLACEIPHRFGFWHGTMRGWYASGRPEVFWQHWEGAEHGLERRWREDGSIESDALWEFGTLLASLRWDEAGQLTEARLIDPSFWKYDALCAHRTWERNLAPSRRFVRGYVDRPAPVAEPPADPTAIVFTWSRAGRAETETHYSGGERHGLERRWRPDGVIGLDAVYEHGVCVARVRWAEDNSLSERWVISMNEPEYDELQRRRRAAKPAEPSAADRGGM